MENINELKKQQSDIHPGFGSYLECMTRALFTGVAAFTLAFSGSFIGQTLLKKHIPYGKNTYILLSAILATGVSYHVTTQRTKSCQAAWMAAEDKHTYFKQGSETGESSH